jgi:hypothetical protein
LAEDNRLVASDKTVLKKVAEIDTAQKFVQNKYKKKKKRILNLKTPKNENYVQNTVDVKYAQKV